MKRLVKFLVFCLIFFLIFAGFMAYDSDKNAYKDIFSSEYILNKLNIQQLNQVKLSDKDIENIINSSLSSYNNSIFLFNGCNAIIYPNNKTFIKLYLKNKATGFPTSVSFNFNFKYINKYMNISITKAYIGKLPIPLNVLRLLVKYNITRLENINSAIKGIDANNLTIDLDLNSLISQKQIFTIKNISSENHNIILYLSFNNMTDSISKLKNIYDSLDNNSKQQVLSFLESNDSIDKKIQLLKIFNIEIDKTDLEKFIKILNNIS